MQLLLRWLTLLGVGMLFFTFSSADAYAGGSFTATGTTTNGTSQNADPNFRPNNDPGAITIVTVKVNGVTVPSEDYVVYDNGTSQARVHFYSALPNATPVELRGTTTNSGEHTGSLTFS